MACSATACCGFVCLRAIDVHVLQLLLEAAGITPAIKPDNRLEVVRRKLEKLSAMVETLRKHVINYATTVRAMTEASSLIAQDTQQFYRSSGNRRLAVEYVRRLGSDEIQTEVYCVPNLAILDPNSAGRTVHFAQIRITHAELSCVLFFTGSISHEAFCACVCHFGLFPTDFCLPSSVHFGVEKKSLARPELSFKKRSFHKTRRVAKWKGWRGANRCFVKTTKDDKGRQILANDGRRGVQLKEKSLKMTLRRDCKGEGCVV